MDIASENPLVMERLVDVARAILAAGRGKKTAMYEQAARDLDIAVPTLHRYLKHHGLSKPRKQRNDKGKITLSEGDALKIAAAYEESRRLTGTGTVTLVDIVDILRRNGEITAGRINESTGEFTPLSESAIWRGLKRWGVHPEMLTQPSYAMPLASPHPNWCWQIDASISRQFYMADDGAQLMAQDAFYRGKPKNFSRISDRRLWRYAVTDHASGCMELYYVLGSESAGNLLDALIHAMVQRPDSSMHGVPHILYSDPGSAMTSSPVKNLANTLGMRLLQHEAGNARATGSVESAHNIIERHFEAPLKLRKPVTSLDEINALARAWCRASNATRIHSRTLMTRRDGWLRITPEQLVIAPPAEVLRALAVSAPKTCTVRDGLIKFRGAQYDVRRVPELSNGQRVQVTRNPWDDASARLLRVGDDGHTTFVLVPRVELRAFGFVGHAQTIGLERGKHAETPADVRRAQIERLAMNASTDEEAKAKRKAKALPFDGRIDPMKAVNETPVTPALPRAGRAADVRVSVRPLTNIEWNSRLFQPPTITAIAAAMRLRGGHIKDADWQPDYLARISARYGDAVPEDALRDVAQWLRDGASNVVTLGAKPETSA